LANILEISTQEKDLNKILTKLFQSGRINFLIGSGASVPAIKVASGTEKEIQELFVSGEELEANQKIWDFLTDIQIPNDYLISGEVENLPDENDVEKIISALNNYKDFINNIETILIERRTNLLPKQANIFTTNYDLFFEKASESFSSLNLNDGFLRTPNLKSQHTFSSKNFHSATYNSGNLYNYKVEIPSLNLVKLHGSLSWKNEDDNIIFTNEIRDFPDESATLEELQEYNNSFALVLPRKAKFEQTLLDRTYYDLLRIYANELDKENTLLVTFGFSFEDEHIYDITKRALKNPTLRLLLFSYTKRNASQFQAKFNGFNNVTIVSPTGTEKINFTKFNSLLRNIMNYQETSHVI
jgi:hypothetical protein